MNKDKQDYNELHQQIQKKSKEARIRYLNVKYYKIEGLQKLHDSFSLHKKIKEMIGNDKNKKRNILVDEIGDVAMDSGNQQHNVRRRHRIAGIKYRGPTKN